MKFRFLSYVSTRRPAGLWRFAFTTLALFVGTCTAAMAQTCPSTDPNQNYNCPVGPNFTFPGWGNVPWSLPQYSETIQLGGIGDINGSGKAYLIGRGPDGLRAWWFNTDLGIWAPILNQNGSAPLVLPYFSDANGWNEPQYYSTIRIVNVGGAIKELVARSKDGLVMFSFHPNSCCGEQSHWGAWWRDATSGPFKDTDCVGSKCWNDAPYYQTLRFGLDDNGNTLAVGWGPAGLQTWQCSCNFDSSWTLAGTDSSFGDAATSPNSSSYQVMNVGIGGGPQLVEVGHDQNGLTVWDWEGTSWTKLPYQTGLFPNTECNDAQNSCGLTLQSAHLDASGVPTVMVRVPGGCPTGAGGMNGLKIDPQDGFKWDVAFIGGPFSDCTGFAKPQNFRSIQAADIDGDGIDELVGRGPNGILIYHWNATSKTWTPLVTNVPALSDTLWASDPSYWGTIHTAPVDDKHHVALTARGQTGVRTWFFQNGTMARPQPYGNYPPFTGAEATAYQVLNSDLGLGTNGLRLTYTDPARDNTSSALRGYVFQIQAGCTRTDPTNPPQYTTCTPPSGTTNPAYTNVVNQLTLELWFAADVVDHFDTLGDMQTQLFTVEGTEFPAIGANLQLPVSDSTDSSGAMNWLNLVASIFNLAGGITGSPEISVTADVMSTALSAQALFQQPNNSVSLAQTYAQVSNQLAAMQQASQSLTLARKHHVLSDYAYLSQVGSLVDTQMWTLNELGYLSVSRQAFTTWVYQGMLPAVWNLYSVQNCINRFDVNCDPPPNGANMQSYGGGNFTGLLQNGSACNESCGGPGGFCTWGCTWYNAQPATVGMVFNPILPQCVYSPGSGNSWIYPGTPGSPTGCTLGAGSAPFDNTHGWTFQGTGILVGPPSYGVAVGQDSDVTLARRGRAPSMHLTGTASLSSALASALDLSKVSVRLNAVAREIDGAAELVRDTAGNTFPVVTLSPSHGATATEASFNTIDGQSPKMTVTLKRENHNPALQIAIAVDQAKIVAPQLCEDHPRHARLQFDLQVLNTPQGTLDLEQVEDWRCVFDRAGNLRELRAAGNPAIRIQNSADDSPNLLKERLQLP